MVPGLIIDIDRYPAERRHLRREVVEQRIILSAAVVSF